MINDDLEPIRTKSKTRDLQSMSIQELEDYIAALEEEIHRADEMIIKKQAYKNGLESVFAVPSEDE